MTSIGPEGESVRYVVSNDLRDTEKKIIKSIKIWKKQKKMLSYKKRKYYEWFCKEIPK